MSGCHCRARESVRAITIIDLPFFPTAGNASPAQLASLPPAGGREKWTVVTDSRTYVVKVTTIIVAG